MSRLFTENEMQINKKMLNPLMIREMQIEIKLNTYFQLLDCQKSESLIKHCWQRWGWVVGEGRLGWGNGRSREMEAEKSGQQIRAWQGLGIGGKHADTSKEWQQASVRGKDRETRHMKTNNYKGSLL